LNEEEKFRANKFRFPEDQFRFTIGRGVLRILLSRYLGLQPERISFFTNKHGKLFISNSTQFFFNLSHSQDIILYAFSDIEFIGVDVEQIKENTNCHNLAKRFFSEQENFNLGLLPPEKFRENFFRCWSRKEAFVKAKGTGLSLPLKSFSIIHAEKYSFFEVLNEDGDLLTGWTVCDLKGIIGYSSALAVNLLNPSIDYYSF